MISFLTMITQHMRVSQCVRVGGTYVCAGLRVCASLSRYFHSRAEHNQRGSHLQSVIRMLISPWELTGTSVLQGLD